MYYYYLKKEVYLHLEEHRGGRRRLNRGNLGLEEENDLEIATFSELRSSPKLFNLLQI